MSPLPRRAALLLPLLLAAAPFSRAAAAVDTQAVIAPITALDNGLIQIMKAGKQTPFNKRYLALAPLVDRALDISTILRRTVGLSWSQIPAAQQIQLQDAFERFTIASYVANFDSYDGQRFETLPTLRQAGSNQIVQTRLIPRTGTPTKLDYVMHQTTEGWKAVDVLLDGTISRVAVQRSDFSSILSSGGASALLASLQKKVTQLSGGTIR